MPRRRVADLYSFSYFFSQGPAKSGVFVFTLDGVFKQKFPFPSGLNNPGSMVFGYSLGINDDNEIAVGAFEHYSGQSRVYIFRYAFFLDY